MGDLNPNKLVMMIRFHFRTCVRPQEGFCSISYSANAFSVSFSPVSLVGTSCTQDYLIIPNSVRTKCIRSCWTHIPTCCTSFFQCALGAQTLGKNAEQRYCGTKLGCSSFLTANGVVMATLDGPTFELTFVSDAIENFDPAFSFFEYQGYEITYQQIPC